MKSIQEIFSGDFAAAKTAVVQKLRPDKHNISARELNFTEHWPQLKESYDLIVLAFDSEESDICRDLWVGFLEDVQPSGDGTYRIYADRFRMVGAHDRSKTSDAEFYGTLGGGGSRVIVKRRGAILARAERNAVPGGQMEQRLMWVRKNHSKFRDPVWRYWDGRCAVSDKDCDGLLVASHIHPWARSTPAEKTDVNNGLLLSVPLDKLFDRGWIGFTNDGKMLVNNKLKKETGEIFGLPKSGSKLRDGNLITTKMKRYLTRHRKLHGFE